MPPPAGRRTTTNPKVVLGNSDGCTQKSDSPRASARMGPLVDSLDELVSDLRVFEELTKDIVVNLRTVRTFKKFD